MPKLQTLAAATICTVLLSAQAWAQLNKAQAGREAVGNCYARCYTVASAHALSLVAAVERVSSLAWSMAVSGVDEDGLESIFSDGRTNACHRVVLYMSQADSCYAGCRDVERAYGVKAAEARTRFIHTFNEDRALARQSGLWTDYRTSIYDGGDFDAACARMFELASSSGDRRVLQGMDRQRGRSSTD